MSTTPTFSAQTIGQTEKALNAILGRLLTETGLTEPQWVALNVTAVRGGGRPIADHAREMATAMSTTEQRAHQLLDQLRTRHLISDGETARLTAAGQRLYSQIRTQTAEIMDRLWGDLPAEQLETAGQVLTTVLARAQAELV